MADNDSPNSPDHTPSSSARPPIIETANAAAAAPISNSTEVSTEPAKTETSSTIAITAAPYGPCSICHEVPTKAEAATVQVCGHTFCAGCVVSWGAVRGMCALCRAPFTCLLVNRNLDGTPCSTPISEPVTLLRRAAWVNAVSITPDIDTFAPPPADIEPLPLPTGRVHVPAPSTAPYYASEDVEDILEDLFWAEEEKNFGDFGNGWDDNMARRRVVGNRPFGSNGFMASGRRSARPNTRRQAAAARSAAAASSSAASSSSAQASPARGRKKKVKKNSRAGKAAAQAQAAAAKVKEAAKARNEAAIGGAEAGPRTSTNSVGAGSGSGSSGDGEFSAR